MAIIDDRTTLLGLALPNKDNTLEDDVDRLRSALSALDTFVAGKQPNLGFTAENLALKGAPSGYAGLDTGGKIPASQLPSYVDDVIEVANFASLATVGETGKIYVTLDNNRTYRWSGSAYVEISASPGSTDAVPEGASNKYFTDARAIAAIPVSAASTLGGIKIGSTLVIDGSGVADVKDGGVTAAKTDGSIAKIGAANTFTAINTPWYKNTTTMSASGTLVFDPVSLGQVALITLTGAIAVVFGAPTSITEGAMYKMILRAGDTSARTFAWNVAYKFPSGSSPLVTGSKTTGSVDIITFIGGPSNTLIYDGSLADVR